MSSDAPQRRHRHTRSAAIPSAAASSQNPQNPHHLNDQAHARNNEPQMNMNNAVQASQPSTPPRTPRRNNQQASQNATNPGAPETGSKQRSRNKNRPKNVLTSPAVTRNDRTTPPLTGTQSAGISSAKPINTPSTVAYAGPTFHASPAPSALPIPSFYSKSVPDSPGIRTMKPPFKDNPASSHIVTPPSGETLAAKTRKEESPLDIFFNADRAEKERARSAIPSKAIAHGPFQPPAVSPRTSQTPPAPRTQTRPQQTQSKRISSSSIFTMEELDGDEDSGSPFGPAFSTPYSERINAARSGNQSAKFSTTSTGTQQQNTDALKAYLFSDVFPVSPSATDSSAGSHSPYSSTTLAQYQSPYKSLSGPKSAGLPHRPQYNNYFNPDSRPRPSARSSGLRQEVSPTKTPNRTPDRNKYRGHPSSPSKTPQDSSDSKAFNNILLSDKNAHVPNPSFSTTENNTDIQGMEETLRKILRLDSGSNSGVPGSGVNDLSGASAPVPNYIGGRAPPMNGIHNGVMGS